MSQQQTLRLTAESTRWWINLIPACFYLCRLKGSKDERVEMGRNSSIKNKFLFKDQMNTELNVLWKRIESYFIYPISLLLLTITSHVNMINTLFIVMIMRFHIFAGKWKSIDGWKNILFSIYWNHSRFSNDEIFPPFSNFSYDEEPHSPYSKEGGYGQIKQENIFKEEERNSRVRKVSQHEEMIYICVYTMLPWRRVFSCSTNLYISQRNEWIEWTEQNRVVCVCSPSEKLFLVNSSEFSQSFCVSPYSWSSWFVASSTKLKNEKSKSLRTKHSEVSTFKYEEYSHSIEMQT